MLLFCTSELYGHVKHMHLICTIWEFLSDFSLHTISFLYKLYLVSMWRLIIPKDDSITLESYCVFKTWGLSSLPCLITVSRYSMMLARNCLLILMSSGVQAIWKVSGRSLHSFGSLSAWNGELHLCLLSSVRSKKYFSLSMVWFGYSYDANVNLYWRSSNPKNANSISFLCWQLKCMYWIVALVFFILNTS
jgi:hypothetical protein